MWVAPKLVAKFKEKTLFQRVDNQVASSEGSQYGRATQEGSAPSTPRYVNRNHESQHLMIKFSGFGDEEYYALYGTPEQYQRYGKDPEKIPNY